MLAPPLLCVCVFVGEFVWWIVVYPFGPNVFQSIDIIRFYIHDLGYFAHAVLRCVAKRKAANEIRVVGCQRDGGGGVDSLHTHAILLSRSGHTHSHLRTHTITLHAIHISCRILSINITDIYTLTHTHVRCEQPGKRTTHRKCLAGSAHRIYSAIAHKAMGDCI